MHSSIFKAAARRALQGKWQKMAWIVFVGTLISGGIQLNAGEIKPVFQLNVQQLDPGMRSLLLIAVCVCLLLALVVGAVVNVGLYNLSGRLIDGEEPRMKMLFPRKVAFRAVAMNVLRALIVYAVMLVALAAAAVTRSASVLSYGISIAYAPAFFLSYCYAMADYLLLTNPKMGPVRALKESRARLKGFKSDLFWLELSFVGWTLVSMLPPLVIMSLLIEISMQAAIVAGFAATIVCGSFVSAYQVVAKTAFFREVDSPDDGYAQKRRAQQEQARQMYEEMRAQANASAHKPSPQSDAAPDHQEKPEADPEQARNLFLDHRCSRIAMREDGVMDQYEGMGVDPSMETRWIREYADLLIRRFDRDSDALDDILRLASEYAHEEILDRAVMRIERHIRQNTLSAEAVLGMAGRVVVLLKSGVYDENPHYVDRKMTQMNDLTDRLAEILGETPAIQKLREMMRA